MDSASTPGMLIERWEEIPFSRLDIKRRDIYLNMGSGPYDPDPEMRGRVESAISHIATFCRPRFGYRVFPREGSTADSVSCGGITLHCGSVISPVIAGGEYQCLFVATAGAEFQQWMEEEAHSGDILREFVSNNIGSEIAEATARVAIDELSAECAAKGLSVGNSYSPGYCGWRLTDQKAIFSVMPSGPCGIRLTDSCLMIPIKSVSGVLPVGKDVVKKMYSCAVCERTDCYKKVHRKLPA